MEFLCNDSQERISEIIDITMGYHSFYSSVTSIGPT